MIKSEYDGAPIKSVDALACALSIELAHLLRVAKRADVFYYPHERKQKPDGGFREVYGVNPPLKDVQKLILERIIRHVQFAPYLQGSIRDTEDPRSARRDAELHADRQIVIRLDIHNFFPSIKAPLVHDIWERFFHFSDGVAGTPTKLTTFDNFLPQGASTSSAISNLIFWESEPRVENQLRQDGFLYTRYVDDVTISADRFVAMPKLSAVFSRVIGMFSSQGLRPNRKKTSIRTSGHRQTVHNLVVNSTTPKIPKKERDRIRAAVFECEQMARLDFHSDRYEELWSSARGKVGWLGQFHPKQAEVLLSRLLAIQPWEDCEVPTPIEL